MSPTAHTLEAVATQTYVAFPYDDVLCPRCEVRVGAFLGKVRCWSCRATVIAVDGRVRVAVD